MSGQPEAVTEAGAACTACTPADGIMVSCEVEGTHERHRGTYVREFEGAGMDVEVSWQAGEAAERDLSVPLDEYPAFRAPEPLVMPQDEFGLVWWLQDALAEAIGPQAGLAAVGRALEAVTPVVEHAARAAAGSHEGIRLWMLDCGALVQKHREHAVEASARLGEQRERAERAEAQLAAIGAHAPAIVDALRHALAYVEHVPGPSAQAATERYRGALAAIGDGQERSDEEETDRG